MNFEFSEEINNFLKIILKNALKLDKRVFFVGGIVRDKILGVKTQDIDLLILGNAIEFAKNLPDVIKIKSIHEDFATVKVEYQNLEIDIASSRIETYPKSGCLPVVGEVGVELEKDVLRRDFSINSIYCELKLVDDEIKYELIDLVNGINDIKNKTLRVLHDKSYIDDPTRIIRGVNFKHRFGFDFSKNDKNLILKYLKNIDYDSMSFDRIFKVFIYVLSNEFQDDIFVELAKEKYHLILNRNKHKVDIKKVLKIAKLFSLNKEQKAEFFVWVLRDNKENKLKLSNLLDIYKTFLKFSLIQLAYYFYKTNDKNVLKYLKIKDIRLNIAGSDLLELGFSQGKNIGLILDSVLVQKLKNSNKFLDKKAELDWVLDNYSKILR